MNIKLMLVGLTAIHFAAGYSVSFKQFNVARALHGVEGDSIAHDSTSTESCGGSGDGSNEVKSLLLTRDGTPACDNSENIENTDDTDATNHHEQTLQVSKLVAGPDKTSIVVASHVIMMTLKGNKDGVGSYTCMIDSTGSGAGIWTEMEVTSNYTDKISPDEVADVIITATISPNQTCTGRLEDKDNVCMVKCRDAANPGSNEKSVLVQIVKDDNTPTPTSASNDIEARASSGSRAHISHGASAAETQPVTA